MRLPRRPAYSVFCRDNGFSLVEAVVSLTLLGVLLTLAFSGRNLIDDRRLAGAARTLGTEVRWVEQRARAERRCWQIEFDPGGERYHIRYLVWKREGGDGSWTAASGCTGETWTRYTPDAGRVLPSRINLFTTTFGSHRMTVSPFGNPKGGEITLRSPGGAQRFVTVNPMGRVTIR